MAFVTAAKIGDIPSGKGTQVEIAGKALALFNSNGTYYAIDGTCTHREAPLAEGDCEGDVVCCPWHGAHFSLTTGAHLSPPATRGVKAYQVQVVGDEIQIDV